MTPYVVKHYSVCMKLIFKKDLPFKAVDWIRLIILHPAPRREDSASRLPLDLNSSMTLPWVSSLLVCPLDFELANLCNCLSQFLSFSLPLKNSYICFGCKYSVLKSHPTYRFKNCPSAHSSLAEFQTISLTEWRTASSSHSYRALVKMPWKDHMI